MSMSLIVTAICLLVISGSLALLLWRRPRLSSTVAAGGAVTAALLGGVVSLRVLLSGAEMSLFIPWPIPGGSFHLGLDALSAFFLLPILGLGALCAVYGAGYFQGHKRPHSVGLSWFHYNLLVASMVMVVLSRNALLFLLSWETMALASFFLVMFDGDKGHVRAAGWVYMLATHLGTAFLLALFAILGEKAGSFEFDAFASVGAGLSPTWAGVAFVFALIGFGTKAGYIPVHVWLPEAHPAAPSHVSALMSGVMIKTGLYGLLRLLSCLGAPAAWWGWTLVAVGLVSAVLGVLFALAQNDIKRLLAYSSVENMGIITIGLGLGYVGLAQGSEAMALLGFAGALLHVLNHSVFKGLLFLGAGSVLHGAGTGDLNVLGGLLKRMRVTGTSFLIGSVAICGLPPLNGFVSEFLIYLGAFRGVVSARGDLMVASLAVIGSLAIVGVLAAGCFTKAFGIAFLGEPRSDQAAHAHEANLAMRAPMLVLAGACILLGLFAPLFITALGTVLAVLMKGTPALAGDGLAAAAQPLLYVAALGAVFLVLVATLALLRRRLLRDRPVGETGTWDCGYARPTTRMQYTATSYAQPLTDLFAPVLRTRSRGAGPEGILPGTSTFSTEGRDLFRNAFYEPLFERSAGLLARLRTAQQGRVQLYVLYVAVTLIALLIFSLQ